MEEIVNDMDSYEYVQMFDLDALFTTEVNSEHSFHLEGVDYSAIKIAQATMRKLLKRPTITPRQIIGIGNYLFALECKYRVKTAQLYRLKSEQLTDVKIPFPLMYASFLFPGKVG
ncbi:MAG: hypothetical protein JJE08_09845 [Proteiniphilum sp.]|nr:hypothetical protein [Proteiniphilum sp.]